MNNRNKRELTPYEFIDALFKPLEGAELRYPEHTKFGIFNIKTFYETRDEFPDFFKGKDYKVIVVDGDWFKQPFKYYRYNSKTNKLEGLENGMYNNR